MALPQEEGHGLEQDRLTNPEFAEISRLVYRHFGIVLGQEKRSLIISRLNSCLAKRGVGNFGEYILHVKQDRTGELLSELINQISTNFTSFYREPNHFAYFGNVALQEVLADLGRKKSRDLRIWCAACSSGEEAYSLQMTIMRKMGLEYATYDAGLLATDISAKVLDIAKAGIYSEEQMIDVPADIRAAYFKKVEEGRFTVKDNVKNQIVFRRFNLMNTHFPFSQPFQVIFCRNVMIYFDEETRRALIRRFQDCLELGGYLFIGHSESIASDVTGFKSVAAAIYRKTSHRGRDR